MKVLCFRSGDRPYAGLVYHENQVVVLEKLFFKQFKRPFKIRDVGDLLNQGGMKRLRELDLALVKTDRNLVRSLRDVEILAPVLRPPKLVCVGLNYRDHAEEQAKPVPEKPLLFCKASNVVIGPEKEVRLPKAAPDKVDYEVEFAAVIGKPGSQIPREQAESHIFGYTVVNDITARDVQKSDRQWFRGKSFDTFAPMGPVIVTPDSFKNGVEDLSVRMRINGEERQSSSTRNLVFDVPFLIEYLSAAFPLEAGDVISTGTPGGVGVFRDPPIFLKSGDEMEAEIEGIGVLRNRVT
jgi:acylpyruvate hydrolase